MWRSLVAHLTGGQGVAGSNPVIPTVFSQVSTGETSRSLAVAREDCGRLASRWGSGGRRCRWRTLAVCVRVGPRFLCGACEPVGQHGGGGLPREPWTVAFEHARQTSLSPCPPRDAPSVVVEVKGGMAVEVVHRRCAGIDVSKRDAKVAVRVVGGGRAGTSTVVTTWSSMTGQIVALREHLLVAEVSCVVMEATGDYWKPFYYLLEDGPWQLMLVNARHARNMPGRKTDVSDAAWLAQLGAHQE